MASSFRIRKRLFERDIRGVVGEIMAEGKLVNFDPADQTKLKKASGKRCYVLAREVVTLETLQSQLIVNQTFPVNAPVKNPVPVGDVVAAHGIGEGEFEGPEFIYSGGTGTIDGSTALDSALSTNNGMLSVRQGSEELVGYLRAKLPVEDDSNAVRALVEFV